LAQELSFVAALSLAAAARKKTQKNTNTID